MNRKREMSRETDDEVKAGLEPVYTEAQDANLELSIRLLREHHASMTMWLAVETLLTHPDGLRDDALVDRLLLLQERLEAELRAAA
jgi:hypothetical protein